MFNSTFNNISITLHNNYAELDKKRGKSMPQPVVFENPESIFCRHSENTQCFKGI
jgi:hypothetical protein